MEGAAIQPHILLGKADVCPVMLTVGDPARVEEFAKLCEKAEKIAQNREYVTYRCHHQGQSFLVSSSGVGSPGAAISFTEFIQLGVKVIIRAGTAGSLQSHVRQGDVVVVQGAVREDGVSALHIPLGYPALADPLVFDVLREIAGTIPSPDAINSCKTGLVLTSDLFYKPMILPNTLQMYADAKVECIDMECSALFIIARLKGIRAGSLLTIDGSPLRWEKGDYDPSGKKVANGKNHMLRVALAALVKLSSMASEL